MKILDQIKIELRNNQTGDIIPVYIDAFDNSLSRKWLTALNHLLKNNYHLEKNYCFFGWVESERNGPYILDQVNRSIECINRANIGYTINDHFSMSNCLTDDEEKEHYLEHVGRNLVHEKFNWLHRYFEDLQGVSGNISPYYHRADPETKWHIRQLNLLCHEFESWALSYKKEIQASEWRRPSQLMCWLNAPRFSLDEEDYELFGVDTINRNLGGVFVGVNKAVGKHHWEVFNDEGRDSRLGELVSTTLRSQTEAAGDFDIEWGRNPGEFEWQQKKLNDFREWLAVNGFDPENKALTIGHPQVGQVDLDHSFGTRDFRQIWSSMADHLDVFKITTSDAEAIYEYHWNDADYMHQQIQRLTKGN